jgi:hypothetical protein
LNTEATYVFTKDGMGDAPQELQQILINKFFSLLIESGQFPRRMLFYTNGVKLVCQGSPILDQLHFLEKSGVELIVCKTCIDFFGLQDSIEVGILGGMPDIIEALQRAARVIYP